MPSCEMCGRDVPGLRKALIEGTSMNVCGNCVKFGVEQAGAQTEVTGRSRITASLESRAKRSQPRDIYAGEEMELAPDYGERVRKARQRTGLSVEDFGKKINERATILAKVESGSYHPDDGLVAKLEKELNVKLKEKVEKPAAGLSGPQTPDRALTLGDLIKKASEKKK